MSRILQIISWRTGAVQFLALVLMLSGCGYRAPLHNSYIPVITDPDAYAGIRDGYKPLAALMEKDTGLEPTGGNTLALLPVMETKCKVLEEDLQKAHESVYVEHYRFYADSFGSNLAGQLTGKARAGVDVRVIIDKAGNPKAERDSLRRIFGGDVRLYYFSEPSLNGTRRDHRKIILVDGQTGYLGGRNIADKYVHFWRDADMRITGPAVDHLTAVYGMCQDKVASGKDPLNVAPDLQVRALRDSVPYLEQIRDATVQIVYDNPGDRLLPIRNGFEWAISNAKKYFWFYNPYSPPPATTLKALKDAATRGVDVRWITPDVNDVPLEKWMGESIYRELLEAGVRIFEWQDEYLHAKEFLSDDYLTFIGSANMDNLSFFMNYEVMAIVYDEAATRAAARTYLSDIENHCREITLQEIDRWPALRRLRNWFTRAVAGALG